MTITPGLLIQIFCVIITHIDKTHANILYNVGSNDQMFTHTSQVHPE